MADEPLDLTWINRLGSELGLDPLDQAQVDALLRIAADAAHDSGDRRNAPMACFLTGLRLGRDGADPTPAHLLGGTA